MCCQNNAKSNIALRSRMRHLSPPSQRCCLVHNMPLQCTTTGVNQDRLQAKLNIPNVAVTCCSPVWAHVLYKHDRLANHPASLSLSHKHLTPPEVQEWQARQKTASGRVSTPVPPNMSSLSDGNDWDTATQSSGSAGRGHTLCTRMSSRWVECPFFRGSERRVRYPGRPRHSCARVRVWRRCGAPVTRPGRGR